MTRTAQELENDPVGLEIMWNRLINITEQCWHTVIRTAFSLIIGEAQDFACEILDAKGQQLAHSPRAMPVFNITLAMREALMGIYDPVHIFMWVSTSLAYAIGAILWASKQFNREDLVESLS